MEADVILSEPFSLSIRDKASASVYSMQWRRERDSNPRYLFRHNGFQDRRYQPLTHPSAQ